MNDPSQPHVHHFKSADEARAYMETDEFKRRFADAQRDAIRADERRRIVEALRHHGHAGDGTALYEAADFIERRAVEVTRSLSSTRKCAS